MRVRYATAVIAMAVIPIAACGSAETTRDPGVDSPTAVETSEQPGVGEEGRGGASQSSLQDRVGQQVELIGEVAAIIGPHALTLGGDQIGENPILVVGTSIPKGVTEGEQIRVNGIVKIFQVPGYEQDLDLDLVDQELEGFDGDPAIQAESVARV
ncbi:MAG: hypothetical protein ACRDTG_10030 [Pseudonocardiaceae bacterium]